MTTPLSPGDAFWASIVALKPDAEGRSRWTRAAFLTGLSETHLRKCASGERPIRLQDAELFDRINTARGAPPDNEEALQARRLAALAGVETTGPDPESDMERSINLIARVKRAVAFGKGNPQQLRSLFARVHKEMGELLDAITIRETEARRNQDRRASDSEMRLVRKG
jgi:hypothetical protein